ncbi:MULTISPECIES: DinB family protein [Streptomyces]|uniref:mycothiol transferase n=1 Tax=Streptomyces TaxID=1883 RepID=UPI000CD5664E|nr:MULTISPECIES: DinB family protein [Streptomyces]
MDAKQILTDGFGRIREVVHDVVDDLPQEHLNTRPAEGANPIGWLVWHLTRVQDDHVADAAGTEQVWNTQGWAERFGLALPETDTGYGHGAAEVEAVRVTSGDLLTGYYDAVHERTLDFVSGLRARDLEEIVDASWDPPVTLGVRLVSVLGDDLEHAGQAAYVRGMLRGR